MSFMSGLTFKVQTTGEVVDVVVLPKQSSILGHLILKQITSLRHTETMSGFQQVSLITGFVRLAMDHVRQKR